MAFLTNTSFSNSSTYISQLLLAIRNSAKISRKSKLEILYRLMHGEIEGELKSSLLKLEASDWKIADNILEEARREDVSVLNIFDEKYPAKLRAIPDAPSVLFYKGNLDVFSSFSSSIAVIGTRRASRYGLRIAKELASKISSREGLVLSGLAYGIDTAAHLGAISGAENHQRLSSSGVAVLGSGLSSIYPKENISLAEKLLASNGLLFSEDSPLTPPRKFRFPERNRIVSGLSDAVVVIDAPERSGALITARLALEQGREVFAVPGQVDSDVSFGSNSLIKDGANVLTSFDDLKDLFKPPLPENLSTSSNGQMDEEIEFDKIFSLEDKLVAKRVLSLLDSNESLHIDYLIQELNLPYHNLQSVLGSLELNSFLLRLAGDYFSRK